MIFNLPLLLTVVLSKFSILSVARVSNTKTNIFYVILILVLVTCARFWYTMPDYETYISYFKIIKDGDIASFVIITNSGPLALEPLFIFIAQSISKFGNISIIFIVFSIIGVTIKALAIRNLTPWFYGAIILYIANYFILHDLIQIRAGIATGFIYLSLIPLVKRQHGAFILCILFGTLFHYSSIIFLFLGLLRVRFIPNLYFFIFALVISYVLYFFYLDPISIATEFFLAIAPTKKGYLLGESGTPFSVMSAFILQKILIGIVLIFLAERVTYRWPYFSLLLQLYLLGCCVYILFGHFPEIAVRIANALLFSEILLISSLPIILSPQIIGKFLVIVFGFLQLAVNVFVSHYFTYA